ncbi:MAG: hypothetical protein ACRDH7_15765 [Actinomycetota bacterium]
MASGRRLAVLVVAMALVGAPAIALRAFCVGKSCADEASAPAPVPFCPLPADLRAQIEAGYRQGRSPDVMAAAQGGGIASEGGVPWPYDPFSPRLNSVPILFFGHGVNPGRLADGIGVDRIAPTIADLIGFDRSHPEVRSGTALPGAVLDGAGSPLVVEIVWKGVGSREFSGMLGPWLATIRPRSAWTLNGTTGSLPVDPAAMLTTIGTGGLPSEHGITGTMIRNAHGIAVPAWSATAPTSIIATLADDWDRATSHRARIGLVENAAIDRGLVGGTWYIDHGHFDLKVGSGDPASAVNELLDSGYGADDLTDIVGVVVQQGSRMARQTQAIVADVQRRVPNATFVLTATGTAAGALGGSFNLVAAVDRAVGSNIVSTAVAGGLFLNQEAMASNDITSDDVVRAIDALKATDGTPLFADAYPGFAVSFSRYC